MMTLTFYHSTILSLCYLFYIRLICLLIIRSLCLFECSQNFVIMYSSQIIGGRLRSIWGLCWWRTDGWDWMVIIGHRYSMNTFGANNYCNNFEEIGILLFQRQQVWPMVQTGSISGFGCLLDISPSSFFPKFFFYKLHFAKDRLIQGRVTDPAYSDPPIQLIWSPVQPS